jgi:hypothetical protein
MQELELTSGRLLRVWWAVAWRFAALFLSLLGIILLLFGLVGIALVHRGGISELLAAKMAARAFIAGMLAGIPVTGMIAVRMALQSQIGRFRLALLENPPSQQESVLESQAH